MNILGRLIVAPAVVVGAVLLMGAKCEQADGGGSASLAGAKKACGNSKYVQISDGGRTLEMDGQGRKDADGAPQPLMACVFDELDTPQSVLNHINRTSAMSGDQTDAWGKYRAGWVYHPDRGLDITITRK